ncbi:hypothetical protein [Saccharothrix sp.]|uniref:hypothetical protein n=1 Tax=Saccharothrix sp. TaxID=1873460 RepID=UPI00281276A2|nr:hypothetical protein [Saccharothrix sp.]
MGFADGTPTPEACLEAANTRPVSSEEPVGTASRIVAGTKLCVLTDEQAVALVEAIGLRPQTSSGSPSVDLRVTLWRK